MTQTPDPSPRREITPELLLSAYCEGIFPMAEPDTGEVYWYRPKRRGIIPLDQFHLPRSDRKVIRQDRFEMRADTRFAEVMRACAEPRPHGQETTWISEELVSLYSTLFEAGFAHCVEAWKDDQLVGGIYGVSIGAAFFGESMFMRAHLGGTNASKVALAWLVAHLRSRGFELFDVQFLTEHLERFGCIEIGRDAYQRRLEKALKRTAVSWDRFPAGHPLDAP